ncbi:lysophospholipid acyltransferase family protein [Actinophytocola sp. NPDC049390]|uniref:lysophospholipid acyltransferase family protein n=1 Tax=Actinophytocola sp. NPDC049390 TaxID=3363894 RepID=UPI003788DE93
MPRRLEKSGFWVWVTAVVFYPIASLGKTKANGAEHVRREGGVLLVMNHISHLDPPVDAVFVHRNGRVPRFLAKDSLFRMPVFKHMISGAGSIPVYRDGANAGDSLVAAREALRDGKLVVIYPEGTITKDPDGWPMRSRTGVARLAVECLEHDIPVLTVARWGTRDILNGYTKKFRPFPRKKVTFDVSAPVDLSEFKGREIDNRLLRDVTLFLMTRVREQLAGLRGEQAPTEFYNPAKAKRKAAGADG